MTDKFKEFLSTLTNTNVILTDSLVKLFKDFEFIKFESNSNMLIHEIQFPFTHIFNEKEEGSLYELINVYKEFINELLIVSINKATTYCNNNNFTFNHPTEEYILYTKNSFIDLVQKCLTGAPGYKEKLNNFIVNPDTLGEKCIIVSIKFGLTVIENTISELFILTASEEWETNKTDPKLIDKISDIEVKLFEH